MKKVLTERDIIDQYRRGNRQIANGADTILTPSAKEAVRKFGMKILDGDCCREEKPCNPKDDGSAADLAQIKELLLKEAKRENQSLTEQNVDLIVQEIAKRIDQSKAPADFEKEADKSGIRLVRGNTVVCETFDTGNPKDRVGIKEILTMKESPHMATGFMTFEKSAFDWTLGYDELDYIVEGNLDIVVDGKTYHGHKGDVFFIPMGTSITFSVPDQCKFFFATYPANWQELSGK